MLNKQSAEVIVDFVFILVTIVDGCAVRKNILRAIVYISDIVQLELLALCLLISVGEVIACVERTVELHVTLREVLLLARDAVHVVIAHGKGVRCRLIVRSPISTRCTCQTVQCGISHTYSLHTHRLVHRGKIKCIMVLSVHQLGNRCAVKDSYFLPLWAFRYHLSSF